MENNFLLSAFVFLMAACLVVPLAGQLRLGSVIGYLLAGIAVGPFGLGLIDAGADIMHFAEFGVIMMLFLIGLELEPATLWRLRRSIVGLGGLQMLITAIAFTAIGISLGYEWRMSLAVSMALSLSSTALVLQLLQEKGLLQTSAGESTLAVLLFQDIAVIPILVAMPLLADGGIKADVSEPSILIEELPAWIHAGIIALVIVLIVAGGRYFSRPVFHYVARTNLREVFTAISLGLVIGITLLMQALGVSPALGAFVAGVVLANSEYRHTIQTDILPFKGLLLGLFFISVGMGMDFTLLGNHTMMLIVAVAVLVLVKLLLLLGLGRYFGLSGVQDTWFALALAQGGEFAFVLFQYAESLRVIRTDDADFLTLAVTLSMVATPFILMINDRFVLPKFMSRLPQLKQHDTVPDLGHPVMIIGYGRFGQIIGRFLSAQGIKLTILEKDPDQIELLRRFGNQVYFGDAANVELLRSAGMGSARMAIVCIDDADKILEIVRNIRLHFPGVLVLARARNRRHAYELHKAGADVFRRETFDSALWMAQEAMKFLGHRAYDMRVKAHRFMKHDEEVLKTSFAFFEREPELISFARQATSELERVLRGDEQDEEFHNPNNKGWGG